MEVVIELFRKIGVSIVLVCHHGWLLLIYKIFDKLFFIKMICKLYSKLLGTISKKDIIKHLESESLKHQK